MSFILVPEHGEDIKINAWNWRPTIAFLHAEGVIDTETSELMCIHGVGKKVDADLARRISVAIDRKLKGMQPGQRFRADLTITSDPKKIVHFEKSDPIDANDLYSAQYEWLVEFKQFCERCGGFRVG
jgi:hypothetical protein